MNGWVAFWIGVWVAPAVVFAVLVTPAVVVDFLTARRLRNAGMTWQDLPDVRYIGGRCPHGCDEPWAAAPDPRVALCLGCRRAMPLEAFAPAER